MSGEYFTRTVCTECNNRDRCLGESSCNHCSDGFVYTKVESSTPPGTEVVPEGTMAKLLEASNHLAWAAEVEIQVGRRPRAFVRQHRAKVRFWIDSVRAILAAHRAAQNDVACAHEWQRTKTEVCEYDFCPKCLAVGDKMTGQVFARFPESSRKKPKETPNAQG